MNPLLRLPPWLLAAIVGAVLTSVALAGAGREGAPLKPRAVCAL